jgi:hypothetical protein
VSRACDTHWRGEKNAQGLVGKPKGKGPLGRLKHRWEQNGCWGDWLEGCEWIQETQNRNWWQALVNAVMNLQVLGPWSWLVS